MLALLLGLGAAVGAPLPGAGGQTPPLTTDTGALRFFSFYDYWLDERNDYNFTQAQRFINMPSLSAQPYANETEWWSKLWLAGRRNWIMWNVYAFGIWTVPCSLVDCSKVRPRIAAKGERSGLVQRPRGVGASPRGVGASPLGAPHAQPSPVLRLS